MNKQIKILFIIDTLNDGGKERQLVELFKAFLNQKNYKCHIIVLSDKIDYIRDKKYNNKITIIKKKTKKDPYVFIKIFNLCKEFRPDLIHSWESMCSIYAIPIAKIFGILFINGMVRYAPSRLHHKLWFRSKITFPLSNVILSNSLAGLQSFRVPKNKGECIHNGFDMARIAHLKNPLEVKRHFQIETSKIVGMIARFHPRKDFKSYIKSALCILEKREDVTFLAIGDGKQLSNCKNIVPIKFKKNIKFLGRQEDVESIINTFDIGVLTSYEEGISNSIMEYMALEKPVVATYHGGNNEIVIDNKTGILVEAGNIEQITKKIEFLLDNPKIGKIMGFNGKRRIQNAFSIDKMIDNYKLLYENRLQKFRKNIESNRI